MAPAGVKQAFGAYVRSEEKDASIVIYFHFKMPTFFNKLGPWTLLVLVQYMKIDISS